MTLRRAGVRVPGQPDVESIIELARTLIAIPSQGGIDGPDAIIEATVEWLTAHQLEPSVLMNGAGDPAGVAVDIVFGPGPRYCLDACLDTAPIGDPAAWSRGPTAGAVHGGWLVGRGAADCKTAIAVFAHIGADLAARPGDLAGTLTLLFDADEHTGRFGGVQAYMASGGRPDGVMIGYPGLDEILVGARGFWRARLVVSGRSGHSGSRRTSAENAIVKAGALVQLLGQCKLPPGEGATFPLGPKITVTEINGGTGYSVVPDRCAVSIDVRLTPRHGADWAEGLVREACRSVDEAIPTREPTRIDPDATWPAYRLPPNSGLASALRAAAQQVLGRNVPLEVAGPSNIGNYLSTFGIEATCGFGCTYRNLHGADEAIDIASVPLVYGVYVEALRTLLARPGADQGD